MACFKKNVNSSKHFRRNPLFVTVSFLAFNALILFYSARAAGVLRRITVGQKWAHSIGKINIPKIVRV